MGAGLGMLFVFTLALTAALGGAVVAYAAYCYLVVVQDTTAGHDRVLWPQEPLSDWLPRSAHVVALFVLWLVPAGLLSHALRADFLADDPALRFFVMAAPLLWLFFPVGLVSSLSGKSRWIPMRLIALKNLSRLLPSVAGFYLCTAVLLGGASALWYVFLSQHYRFQPEQQGHFLPIAAPVGAAVLLIHARLLGRIAWLMQRLDPPDPIPADIEAAAQKKRALPRPRTKRRVRKPWAIPRDEPEKARDAAEPVQPYALTSDVPAAPLPDAPPAESRRGPPTPLEIEGYGVTGLPAPPPRAEAIQAKKETATAATVMREMTRQREVKDPPPRHPLFTGVYTFPWYRTSLKAWAWLTLGAVALGAGLKLTFAFWPF
jgi:hypothetical protein